MSFTIRLPWPPSVNHRYARTKSGGLKLSKYARTYQTTVCALLSLERVQPVVGLVRVTMEQFPPKGRVVPDCDNVLKAVGDALQAGGAIGNDRDIVEWHVYRRGQCAGGEVIVTVEEV